MYWKGSHRAVPGSKTAFFNSSHLSLSQNWDFSQMFRSLCLERWLRGLSTTKNLQAFGVSSSAIGQPGCEAAHKKWLKSQLFHLNHMHEAIISSLRWNNEGKVKVFVLTDCKAVKISRLIEEPLECREWERLESSASDSQNLPAWVSGFGALCHLTGYLLVLSPGYPGCSEVFQALESWLL